jgi:hypothetical protein
MRTKSENIICYINYIQKGINLYKVCYLNSKKYLTIDMNALIQIINDNANTVVDMDLAVLINGYYGNFTNNQLNCILNRVKHIFNNNDKYKEYRGIEKIELI